MNWRIQVTLIAVPYFPANDDSNISFRRCSRKWTDHQRIMLLWLHLPKVSYITTAGAVLPGLKAYLKYRKDLGYPSWIPNDDHVMDDTGQSSIIRWTRWPCCTSSKQGKSVYAKKEGPLPSPPGLAGHLFWSIAVIFSCTQLMENQHLGWHIDLYTRPIAFQRLGEDNVFDYELLQNSFPNMGSMPSVC